MSESPEFNQEAFDKLPMLLGRRKTMEWTGLDGRGLSEAAKAGRIRTYAPHGKYVKYHKVDVAKICGMKS